MNVVLRAGFAGALALAALSGCAASDAEPIFIGVAGPINQANGRSMRLAAEMAVEEINRAGGIDGRPLRLVLKDDQARSDHAIQVAGELRDDPSVVAVIGHINSSATLAAAEVYNHPTNGVLQISPASSSPLVSEAGEWTFRVCPSDLSHGPALARWAYERLDRRSVAVLYRNDDYGRGVMESFAAAFEQAGGAVVARDPLLTPEVTATEADLTPYLERAIRAGADAIVVASQADGALLVLREARRLGFRGPVLGADGLTGLKDAGAVAEGVYISSAFLPDRKTPEAERFVRDYVQRNPGELPDHRGAMAYDALQVIAQGLREVGADRAALRDYVARVGTEHPALHGVSGAISFDPNGDAAGKEVVISVVRGGKLVTAN